MIDRSFNSGRTNNLRCSVRINSQNGEDKGAGWGFVKFLLSLKGYEARRRRVVIRGGRRSSSSKRLFM